MACSCMAVAEAVSLTETAYSRTSRPRRASRDWTESATINHYVGLGWRNPPTETRRRSTHLCLIMQDWPRNIILAFVFRIYGLAIDVVKARWILREFIQRDTLLC